MRPAAKTTGAASVLHIKLKMQCMSGLNFIFLLPREGLILGIAWQQRRSNGEVVGLHLVEGEPSESPAVVPV